jgi:hypothetical protein
VTVAIKSLFLITYMMYIVLGPTKEPAENPGSRRLFSSLAACQVSGFRDSRFEAAPQGREAAGVE